MFEFLKLPDSQRCVIYYLVRSLAVFVLVAVPALAGRPSMAAGVTQDSGYWTTTTGTLSPSDLWRVGMTVQTRSLNDFGDLERTVLRPAVSYKIWDKTWVTAGYDAHFIERPTERLEQRAWQQWLTIIPLQFVSLSARIRLEERFIEGVDGTAFRLRLNGRADFPIEGSKWKLTLSNEYFAGLNDLDAGPNDGFDQNRAYVGVSRPVSEALSVRLGYQNQFINRAGGADDLMVHQLMIGLTVKP